MHYWNEVIQVFQQLPTNLQGHDMRFYWILFKPITCGLKVFSLIVLLIFLISFYHKDIVWMLPKRDMMSCFLLYGVDLMWSLFHKIRRMIKMYAVFLLLHFQCVAYIVLNQCESQPSIHHFNLLDRFMKISYELLILSISLVLISVFFNFFIIGFH